MTQDTDAKVAAIAENVRHNEKGIDLLRSDVRDFRADYDALKADFQAFKIEVYQQFARLNLKMTIGFIVLAALIIFQEQITNLLAVIRVVG